MVFGLGKGKAGSGHPELTVQELDAMLRSGTAAVVDVREADEFAAGHIPGAINILLGEFETNINGIPLEKDQWIITYCT